METSNPESDLESFRQRWREEVSARARRPGEVTNPEPKPSHSGPGRPSRKTTTIPTSQGKDTATDGETRVYHDIDDKEVYLKLGNEKERTKAEEKTVEPHSALEHYEQAVEEETQGKLGDSVNLYRKAFKLDDRVHEVYKAKHFPPSSFPPKPANLNPSNASVTVPNPAHHSLEGPRPDISSMIEEFSRLSIPPAKPESDLSEPPPCPIAYLPEEILVEILLTLAVKDLSSFTRLAQVCKRFTYLVTTEERVWKRITLGHEVGFATMKYLYVCDLKGNSLLERSSLLGLSIMEHPLVHDLTPAVWPTYRSQFRHRPRIRFNGCYISTVNYARPGASHQSRYTWASPVQIVTYYRYLRLFRDGTAISLLTTAAPADVVHHLVMENVHKNHSGALPTAVMKDGLRGRWRLSGRSAISGMEGIEEEENKGPGEYVREPSEGMEEEEEGDLHVETDGVVPKYMWKMQFALGSSGRKEGVRNNKLSWKGFWSYNKLTDDWGEFGLKNDKPYYFSRVKSYGTKI